MLNQPMPESRKTLPVLSVFSGNSSSVAFSADPAFSELSPAISEKPDAQGVKARSGANLWVGRLSRAVRAELDGSGEPSHPHPLPGRGHKSWDLSEPAAAANAGPASHLGWRR